MSAINGRNGVGVELEERFMAWANENVNRVSRRFKKVKVQMIQGDSRNLPKLLNVPIDDIIFFPAYSNIANSKSKRGILSPYMQGLISQLSGIPVRAFAHDYDMLVKAMTIASAKIPFKYSDSPDNIGNMKHGNLKSLLAKKASGKVSAVITSPPYGDMNITAYDNTQMTTYFTNMLKEKGFITFDGKMYSEKEWRALNHGRIDGRTMRGLKKGKSGYSSEQSKPVGAVITSPPYMQQLSQSRSGTPGTGTTEFIYARKSLGAMPENPQQIGDMKPSTYLEAMLDVYAGCLTVLKPGGKMVVVVKDFMKNKKVVYLHEETIQLCQFIGFKYVDHLWFKLPVMSFWRRLQKQKLEQKGEKYPEALLYEHCLVFEKPCATNAAQ
jgi:hypothetical protein